MEFRRVLFRSVSQSRYGELKELFCLQTTPSLIESFDNSHLMGQATVGAMIVWNENLGSFDKVSLYQTQKI